MLKKIWNVVWSVIEFVVIVYVIIMTTILLSKNKFGYTQFGKYTIASIDELGERSIKDVHDGDLLVVKMTNDIKKGDLIYYYAVYDDTYIIRSDVVTDVENDDLNKVYTIDRDGLSIILESRVLGKKSKTYANYGAILNTIESRIGFLFLVLLPILIIFIYQVYEFIVILKYESNEDGKITKNDDSTEIL